jgi:stringent starvation protein B
MSGPPDFQGPSTRPYLLRALHAWCTDNGFTPYVAVHVDASVQVPLEYVDKNEIVLNVGFEATSGLKIGNEVLEFRARFRGVSREIVVPIDHVVAIYARENGQGMAFPMPSAGAARGAEGAESAQVPRGLRLATTEPNPKRRRRRPSPRACQATTTRPIRRIRPRGALRSSASSRRRTPPRRAPLLQSRARPA